MTDPQNVVINPSAWASRVNWTAAITAALTLLAAFGLPITQEQQVAILTIVGTVGPVFVWMFRTFFPGKPATTPQLKAAIAEKKADA